MGETVAVSEVPHTDIENEKQFVVSSLPPDIATQFQKADFIEIRQGYLPDTPPDPATGKGRVKGARIREETKPDGSVRYVWAEKTGKKGAKQETQRTMEQAEFEKRWPETEACRVYKTRHYLPLDKSHTIELDVFKGGQADGKMVAEVEFKDEDDALGFSPPDWFGREITKEFSNRKLAKGDPFPPQELEA